MGQQGGQGQSPKINLSGLCTFEYQGGQLFHSSQSQCCTPPQNRSKALTPMVLGEALLKITRFKVERNQNIYKSTLFHLSLQQLPGCFNQDSQEQIARQIVICRPLVSSGSFPPVQTNKQAALGYGQVGPVVLGTGSLDLMSKTEQDAWKSSAQHHGPARHLLLTSILFTHWLLTWWCQKGASMGKKAGQREVEEPWAGR